MTDFIALVTRPWGPVTGQDVSTQHIPPTYSLLSASFGWGTVMMIFYGFAQLMWVVKKAPAPAWTLRFTGRDDGLDDDGSRWT